MTGLEDESDGRRALALLEGVETKDKGGLPRTEYLVDGSPEEEESRRAIARLLRGNAPLDSRLRRRLADLFDGGSAVAAALFHPRPARLEIKLMGRANSESARRHELARAVWREKRGTGKSLEEAAYEVALRHKLHERSVWNAWQQFRPLIELEEKLDPDSLAPD